MTWQGIAGFCLVTADPERLLAFYGAIGFTKAGEEAIPREEMRVLGLAGRGRRYSLNLGASRLHLDDFDVPGRPYPAASTAADLIFQHLALVTTDADSAWARAKAADAVPISRGGPVTLPPSSGGVTAIKFRDPDGHPLEFLQFPAGAKPGWTGSGVIGIDHSAISVADAAASRRFYEQHGLAEGDVTLNQGAEQVALDALDEVRVGVVPMNPPSKPPHVELLGYHGPRGRPHPRLEPNDIAATRIVWRAGVEALVRDPDGHLHQLTC